MAQARFYDPSIADPSGDVKAIADYDRRRRALLEQRAQLQRQQDEVSQQALKRLEKRDTIGDVEFDALLLPDTGQKLRSLASLLSYYDVDLPAVRLLGLRNWDEVDNPETEPALLGAWFAAPSPSENERFRNRFEDASARCRRAWRRWPMTRPRLRRCWRRMPAIRGSVSRRSPIRTDFSAWTDCSVST